VHEQKPSGFTVPDPAALKSEEASMPYTPGSDAEPASGIQAVRQRHERDLAAIDGVVGLGIGRSRAGGDAIVVYLRDASVEARVPSELDGYPVVTVVTGAVDALGA
jgi:hypothetical protein